MDISIETFYKWHEDMCRFYILIVRLKNEFCLYAVCDPRPQTAEPCDKDGCYVRIYGFRKQISLLSREKFVVAVAEHWKLDTQNLFNAFVFSSILDSKRAHAWSSLRWASNFPGMKPMTNVVKKKNSECSFDDLY